LTGRANEDDDGPVNEPETPRFLRRATFVVLYAVAMAYLESAVVVYLRALYYPDGFRFPLVLIDPSFALLEVGREAATLVMLLGVSALFSADRWAWFLAFCFSFGVWDLFYYVWLWVFLGWPPSLLTWDLLFLIPVPWVGPVLAPVLVSLALVTGSLGLLRLQCLGTRPQLSWTLWAATITGGVLVLTSFMLDFRTVLQPAEPPPFRWGLFAAGLLMAVAAAAIGTWRLTGRRPTEPGGGSP
jgi:hypothetical protein